MNFGHRFAGALALLAVTLLQFGVAPPPTDAVVVPTITAIAAGYSDTCALTTAGEVKCWGYGLHGELGTGSTATSLTPKTVVGLTSGVTAIAGGTMFGCALTSAGGVTCWGWNRGGQLGNGTTTESTVPVAVSGLTSGVKAIAMGGFQACALMNGGGVKCWGLFYPAQPGRAYPAARPTPVDIPNLASGVTAIAVGGGYGCALTSAGGVKCWGANFNGELGDGSSVNSPVPVDVSGLTSGATAIAAGQSHACALTNQGAVRCWGQNHFGGLGNGTAVDSRVPVEVSGLGHGATAVTVGAYHSCALTIAGAVKCWGLNHYSSQLGDGTVRNSSVPVSVVGLSTGVAAISAGGQHTCALTTGGSVKCWGDNTYGQLGNGTRTNSRTPVTVDFAMHQAVDLRASVPAGTITSGTAVMLAATVRPLDPAAGATVRFEIYRRDNGVWRLAARRDVVADGTGRATLPWTFVSTGSRYMRARALANQTYASSPWTPRVSYTVS